MRILAFFVFCCMLSCSKDKVIEPPSASNFVGEWNFVVTPKNVTRDNEIIKGASEADFESEPFSDNLSFFDKESFENHITPDQKHEFPVSENSVAGIYHFFVYILTPTSSSTMEMDIYQRDSLSHKTGIKVSSINLSKKEDKVFEGEGVMHHDVVNDINYSDETYNFKLTKISNSPSLNSTSLNSTSSKHFDNGVNKTTSAKTISLCDIASSVASAVVGSATGSIIRPMGNCWGRRNGGGYYMFGSTGPGSLLPLWTQTAYVPQEWSWCGVRKYNFNIRSKGDVTSISVLKQFMRALPISFFYRTFGLDDMGLIETYVEDLHNKVGGFAISLGYSTASGNLSIYVNLKNNTPESHEIIDSHPLITGLRSTIYPFVHDIYFFIGDNIYDPFNLRRSPFPLGNYCNSPVVFTYLIGTINVEYD